MRYSGVPANLLITTQLDAVLPSISSYYFVGEWWGVGREYKWRLAFPAYLSFFETDLIYAQTSINSAPNSVTAIVVKYHL